MEDKNNAPEEVIPADTMEVHKHPHHVTHSKKWYVAQTRAELNQLRGLSKANNELLKLIGED